MLVGPFRKAAVSAAIACAACIALSAASAAKAAAVKAIGDQRVPVAGGAVLPVFASRPLVSDKALPGIERAIVVMHGRLRNADTYFETGRKAAAAAGEADNKTIVIAPQFLNEEDTGVAGFDRQLLRWKGETWEGGEEATAPNNASSFAALDAVVVMLADRRRFPDLKSIVVAGHSGGGQVVHRYAVVGQGEAKAAAAGIHVRYIVANPSSYLYFSAERPVSETACANVNRWKYGWTGAPDYAAGLKHKAYEKRFLARDVIYLFGARDTDPHHPALDTSCAAEAQGAYRYARGHNYIDYLSKRHRGFVAKAYDVPGVGHDGDRMFGSDCGLVALFDDASHKAACVAAQPRK